MIHTMRTNDSVQSPGGQVDNHYILHILTTHTKGGFCVSPWVPLERLTSDIFGGVELLEGASSRSEITWSGKRAANKNYINHHLFGFCLCQTDIGVTSTPGLTYRRCRSSHFSKIQVTKEIQKGQLNTKHIKATF